MARNEYNIKDRKPGVNFPPFHPWCRCTFEIVVDDWDKWLDDYVKRHKSSGEHLKDILQNGTMNNNKTVISKDVLRNIKSFDLPDFTAKENEELRKAMVKLLERVDGTAQNTECASFYDIHMRFLKWQMGQSGKGSVKMYNPSFDYIALHNHPSGGTFSIGDIREFGKCSNMKYLIVVGNNGEQYLLQKNLNFDGVKFLSEYYNYSVSLLKQNLSMSDILSKCSDFIEKGAKRYGYKFRKINP